MNAIVYYLVLDDGIFGIEESILLETELGVIEYDRDYPIPDYFKNLKEVKAQFKNFKKDAMLIRLGRL